MVLPAILALELVLLVCTFWGLGMMVCFLAHTGPRRWMQHPLLPLLVPMMCAELVMSGLILTGKDLAASRPTWLVELWCIPGMGHALLLPFLIPTLTHLLATMQRQQPPEPSLVSSFLLPHSRLSLATSWLAGLSLSALSLYAELNAQPTPTEVPELDTVVVRMVAPSVSFKVMQLLPIITPSLYLVAVGGVAALLWGRRLFFISAAACFVANVSHVPICRYVFSAYSEVALFVVLALEVWRLAKNDMKPSTPSRTPTARKTGAHVKAA